jgi:hypothetical protein
MEKRYCLWIVKAWKINEILAGPSGTQL